MHIIIIEGVDGTGKSTFAKLLQEKREGVILKFPPSLPEPSDLSDPVTESLFYINGMASCPYFRRSEEDLLFSPYARESNLICDRSFITTMVYQGYVEESTERSFFFDPIFRIGSAALFSRFKKTFDVTFVKLHCELEESLRRMDIRNSIKEEKDLDRVDRLSLKEKRSKLETLSSRFEDALSYMKEETQNTLDRYQPHLQTLNFLEVDTTNSTPEEAVESILHHPHPHHHLLR